MFITTINLYCLFLFYFIILIFINKRFIKLFSLNFSIFLFFLSLYMLLNLDFTKYSFITLNFFTKSFNNILFLGYDQFSIVFILLTTFLFPLVIISAWKATLLQEKFFFFNLIFLEFCLINIFLAFDLLYFYIWFEAVLIPMHFIIITWGKGNRKVIASIYLLMYTLVFSSFFFIWIVYLKYILNTLNIFIISNYIILSKKIQLIIFPFIFLAFAAKLPLFPIHIWLPEAHVEAPTVGSVILAGIILKLGYYGIIRILLPCFKFAFFYYTPFISALSIFGATYCALIALAQVDIKRIVAYSSISHMSIAILGICSLNINGLIGSCLLMISHTFISSGLFMLVGILYDRFHNRNLHYYSGLIKIMPIYCSILFYFIISNFSFPLSLSFIAELIIFIEIGNWNYFILLLLIWYYVLSLVYNLYTYLRLCHGQINNLLITKYSYIDLSNNEIFPILTLGVVNFIFCFFPNFIINFLYNFFILLI